jgi:hypothetical protein
MPCCHGGGSSGPCTSLINHHPPRACAQVQAAQKIANICKLEPGASERRRALLSLDVLPPLVDCLGPGQISHHSDKLRAAAAQVRDNLQVLPSLLELPLIPHSTCPTRHLSSLPQSPQPPHI